MSKVRNNLVGHRNWPIMSQGALESCLIVSSHVEASQSGDDCLGGIESTFAIHSTVRIVLFSHDTSHDSHALECGRRDAAMTSIVTKEASAINELLWCQLDQFSSSDGPLGFQCSSRRECPATSTVPLIADRAHDTLVSPVISSWKMWLRWRLCFLLERSSCRAFLRHFQWANTVKCLEFLPGQVRELVYSSSPCAGWVGIDLLNLSD
mmetsp:Transcript_5738/g.21754  ORF Transcript_5738/g.21754 Transcript_5738/m.21754 type:complete len:208 (+) Transcript_5738:550-1173(+)